MGSKKKKTFCIEILCLVLISNFCVSFGRAETIPYPQFVNNFTRNIIPVISDPKLANLFQVQVSAIAMRSFTSNGIYGQTSNGVIYSADFELQLVCNVFSKFTVASTNSIVKRDPQTWAYILTYPDLTELAGMTFNIETAQIPYITSDVTAGTLGSLDIKLNYVPPETKILTFQGENVTATVPHTEVTFGALEVNSVEVTNIGQYSSQIGFATTTIGASALAIDGTYLPAGMGGDANTKLTNQVNVMQLGVTRVGSAITETLQQYITNPSTRGTTIDPITQSINFGSYLLPSEMSPGIESYNQNFQVRYGSITVDTRNEWYWPNAGIVYASDVLSNTLSYRQNIAFRNANYQYDLSVHGTVFGTEQFDAPLSSAVLDNPMFQAGDYFWDMTITGNTGIDVSFLNAGNPLQGAFENWIAYIQENIGLILGTIVLIAVAIIVVIILFLIIKAMASKVAQPRAPQFSK